METKDVNAVHGLLLRYLERFEMAPNFDKVEVDHWLLHKGGGVGRERVIFTYVVEVIDTPFCQPQKYLMTGESSSRIMDT